MAAAAYVLGWFATAIVFLFMNGSGIEAAADEAIPYYAVFGVLFGAVLGWWWAAAFPVLHFFVFEPIWNELAHEGPVHYVYDRPGYVVAGTLGLAAGLALRTLYDRARLGPTTPST